MFKALTEQKTIILAVDAVKGKDYYCPGCGGVVRLKAGDVRQVHFAHENKCPYPQEAESEYMSEWHLRMQGHFPIESQEYYFDENGEKHRADVFIKEKNTVIEFQKSAISKGEFERRTKFHLNAGRKIVWVFDESKDPPSKEEDKGKLRARASVSLDHVIDVPYKKFTYKWLNCRSCLSVDSGLPVPRIKDNSPNYAICLYTGSEGGDYVHRIVQTYSGFNFISISIHNVLIEPGMDTEDFFRDEEYWLPSYPGAEGVYRYRNITSILDRD